MKKSSTAFCLAFICQGLFGQSSTLLIDKLPVKNALQHLSYIPAKSFNCLTFSGSDSVSLYSPRIATSPGFYISRFEVSNKEYRDFVQYIKDSIAHGLLKHFKKGSGQIDWNAKINWKDALLQPMMLSPEDRVFGRTEINSNSIRYEIDFSNNREPIAVYPDTLIWLSDFSYSYNEPLVKKYFNDKAYDNYPVVGINLKQAMAFCQWKTAQLNNSLKQAGSSYEVIVRLPTNIEWESAASGDNEKEKIFSPGKPYGSNFGPITDNNGYMVKDFKDDGYYYTSPVASYQAGPFGLHNMKGNVAEWTSDAAANILRGNEMKDFFIVKGGGWNSQPFYLQTGACQFFADSAAHSFIGFRYVVTVKK